MRETVTTARAAYDQPPAPRRAGAGSQEVHLVISTLVGRRTVLVAAGALGAAAATGAVVRARNTPAPAGDLRILTGGTLGVYYAFGRELAEQIEAAASDLRVEVQSSSGSVANLKQLATATASGAGMTLAIVAADAADQAVRRNASVAARLRGGALARLYDDYLHLVVRPDADITKVADLAGRRVSVGPSDSGTALIAERVLEVAKVKPGRRPWEPLGINESVEALRSGSIDAFFWSGGVPTSGVADLAKTMAIDLVPMEREAAAMYTAYGRPYRVGSVPPGVYGLKVPVGTLAVPNLLITSPEMPAATSRWIDALLFSSRTAIGREVPAANTLDARTAISVAPVGLHPGAADFFRAQKP